MIRSTGNFIAGKLIWLFKEIAGYVSFFLLLLAGAGITVAISLIVQAKRKAA